MYSVCELAISMFDGEKTLVFWFGLLVLAFASLVLFTVLWFWVPSYSYYSRIEAWRSLVPIVVGAVVFILVGAYMMRSGVKKDQTKTQIASQL